MIRFNEYVKQRLVYSGLYDAVYDVMGMWVNRPFREMSINVLHDKKLIFVHNPKCAGTSVKRVLGLPFGSAADHRIPSYMVSKKTWESYYSFVIVRNPFDRLVSSYAYHTSPAYNGVFYQRYPQLKGLSLEAYFDLMRHEPTAIRPQVDYLEHHRSKKKVDKICRMETLMQDLSGLFQKLGIDAELPHVNRTLHKGYRDCYLDDAFAERVHQYYLDDLEQLKYRF
ncbi:MAG: sulfotransferase family 2 domain-containing protein [Pontiellaceae bacterium]|nr:sulfotransferase family 2 domain-containing protein [Pontiellaceae bacterium]